MESALVTFKLSVSNTKLILETLEERAERMREHGSLNPKHHPGSEEQIKISRHKAIKLYDIIEIIEGD